MNVMVIVEGVHFLRIHDSESHAVRDPLMYLPTLPPRARNLEKMTSDSRENPIKL